MRETKEGRVTSSLFSLACPSGCSKATLVVTPRDGRCGMRFCLFVLFIVCACAGVLPGCPNLDMRTIRVLNQNLWLKSVSARQRKSAEMF